MASILRKFQIWYNVIACFAALIIRFPIVDIILFFEIRSSTWKLEEDLEKVDQVSRAENSDDPLTQLARVRERKTCF